MAMTPEMVEEIELLERCIQLLIKRLDYMIETDRLIEALEKYGENENPEQKD